MGTEMIKLEYGRSYILKDGRETGPLTRTPGRYYDAEHYTFLSEKLGLTWDKDGNRSCSIDISHGAKPAVKQAADMSYEEIECGTQPTSGWQITAGTEPENTPFVITPGIYVQLRSGEKAWVVGKRPNGKWVVYDSEGDEFHMPADGQWPGSEGKDPCDIVGPWVEPPEMERKTVTRWFVVNAEGVEMAAFKSSAQATTYMQKEYPNGEVVELTGLTSREYPVA